MIAIFSKQYKSLRIAAYIFTALTALILFQKRELVIPKVVNPLNIQLTSQKKADTSHQKSLEAIRQEFNIPKSEWQNAMNEFAALSNNNRDLFKQKASFTPGNDSFKNKIYQSLADAGINPQKVSINYSDDNKCPIFTLQEYSSQTRLRHSITINPEWFNKHPVELQKAIIKHEIMHLKNFDPIEYGFIVELLEDHGITRDQYFNSASIQKFRHMRELRADLLAGAHDINVAKALHSDFCSCVARNYQEDVGSHPSSQTRMNQMAQLIKNFEAEQSIKIA